MSKDLTKKEALAVEYFLQGENQTEAVMKAFECKTRDSARSLASRVFSKEKVIKELAERRKSLQQKLTDKTLKFVEIVERYAPKDAIAKQLAENILSNDKRVSDTAIDKYLRLRGEYPPQKMVEMQYRKDLDEDKVKVIVSFKEDKNGAKEGENGVKENR